MNRSGDFDMGGNIGSKEQGPQLKRRGTEGSQRVPVDVIDATRCCHPGDLGAADCLSATRNWRRGTKGG